MLAPSLSLSEESLSSLPDPELSALLRADQSASWARGECLPAENYLNRFPFLKSRSWAVLVLAFNEILLRREHGESPTLEEYLRRFPALDAPLRRRFALVEPPVAVAAASTESPRPSAAVLGTTVDDPMITGPESPTAASGSETDSGPRVPGYEILGVLGEGGMGIVYKAHDLRLKRLVALKTIRTGHSGERERLRLKAEAEAIARLQHPYIVQVFEIGETDGQPYFALEYLEGGSLDRRLRSTLPSPSLAARLVEQLAQAMHAVHQLHLIHRDLKPANVLLQGDPDTPLERCTPKVSDFGLAKFLDDSAPELTQAGQVLGSPCYMAPEQAGGRARDVTPAADVYALGAILYECLTGRPPFKASTLHETLAQVREQEPLPPSRAQPLCPRDLEAICLKCLEKEPPRRYARALDLAEDLRRFQAGEPTRARPPGTLGRVRRWARRHPSLAALGIVLVFALSSLAGSGALFTAKLKQKNNTLGQTNGELTAKTNELTAKTNELTEMNAALEKANTDLAQSLRRTDRALTGSRVNQAYGAWRQGKVAMALELLDACPPKTHGWSYRHVRRLCGGSPFILLGHEGRVQGLAFRPDGRYLASASWDRTVRIWDSSTGRQVQLLEARPMPSVGLVYSPDGRRLLIPSTDGRLLAWSLETGRSEVAFEGHPNGLTHTVVYSPDGKWVASAGGDRRVLLWDAASGRLLRSFTGHSRAIHSLAFSPDSRRLLAGGEDGQVRAWDATTGQVILAASGHTATIKQVAYSSDGLRLASAGLDKIVKVWDARTGQLLFNLTGHTRWIQALAFSPDGLRLASAGEDFIIRLWDPHTGQALDTLPGHVWGVWGAQALAFSPDGERLASAGGDFAIQLWDVRGSASHLTYHGHHVRKVEGLTFRPDGRRVASADANGIIHIWDPHSGLEIATLKGYTARVTALAYSPSGERLVSGDAEGFIRVWDGASGRMLSVLAGPGELIHHLAFAEDGRLAAGIGSRVTVWSLERGRLLDLEGGGLWTPSLVIRSAHKFLAAATGREIKVWNLETGRERYTLHHPNSEFFAIALSPDGRTLVTGDMQGNVQVRDSADGRERFPMRGHNNLLTGLVFGPDGQSLITGDTSGAIKVWDPRSGQELLTLQEHVAPVLALAFDPTGRCLAAADANGDVHVWDAGAGPEHRVLPTPGKILTNLAFSGEGRLAGAEDKQIKVWNVHSGALLRTLTGHEDVVNAVAFAPGGQQLASGDRKGTVKLWDAWTGKEMRSWSADTGGVLSLAFAADGRLAVCSGRVTVWDTQGTKLRSFDVPRRLLKKVGFMGNGRTLVAGAEPGPIAAWDVESGEPVPVPADAVLVGGSVAHSLDGRLCALAGLYGVRILEAKPSAEERACRQAIAQPAPSWHARQALAAEKQGRWYAVAFHLLRTKAETGGVRHLHRRRGRAFAELGRWSDALADLRKAVAVDPLDSETRCHLAFVELEMGQLDAYHRTCVEVLERERALDAIRTATLLAPDADGWSRAALVAALPALAKKQAPRYELLVRTCLLRSDSLGDLSRLSDLLDGVNPLYRGAFLGRTGRPREAREALQSSKDIDIRGMVYAALVEAQDGQKDKARTLLTNINRILDRPRLNRPGETFLSSLDWVTRLELRTLRREIEGLLGTSPPRAKPPVGGS